METNKDDSQTVPSEIMHVNERICGKKFNNEWNNRKFENIPDNCSVNSSKCVLRKFRVGQSTQYCSRLYCVWTVHNPHSLAKSAGST